VLRYTLSSIDAQSKSLYEELDVAESYLHLVKIRFGTSLRVETSVDDRYKNYRLPPLAIQVLLENAIKHNEISKRNPFTIKIETSPDQNLVITNPIQYPGKSIKRVQYRHRAFKSFQTIPVPCRERNNHFKQKQ
jgi:sensor histidine kinase YesM